MVEIYFASNRDVIRETSSQSKNLGTRFNEAGPQFFRVGKAEATFSGNPLSNEAWSTGKCQLFPENLKSAPEASQKVGSASFFKELQGRLKTGTADLVIYIHGFAVDFGGAVVGCASLQELYQRAWRENHQSWGVAKDGAPQMVMFSWPSNGNVYPKYEYFSDREDAEASGLAMARAMDKLINFLSDLRASDREVIRDYRNRGEVPPNSDLEQCGRKIHIITHSMAAFALRHTLRKYAELVGRRPLPRILDNVFLMAPDVDANALSDPQKLGLLTELANNVHVYHSRSDQALQISDETKGNSDRLGADGPTNLTSLDERVFAVDCSYVDNTAQADGNHGYYRLRQEVVNDVLMSIANLPQEGRQGRQTLIPGRSWVLNSLQPPE